MIKSALKQEVDQNKILEAIREYSRKAYHYNPSELRIRMSYKTMRDIVANEYYPHIENGEVGPFTTATIYGVSVIYDNNMNFGDFELLKEVV